MTERVDSFRRLTRTSGGFAPILDCCQSLCGAFPGPSPNPPAVVLRTTGRPFAFAISVLRFARGSSSPPSPPSAGIGRRSALGAADSSPRRCSSAPMSVPVADALCKGPSPSQGRRGSTAYRKWMTPEEGTLIVSDSSAHESGNDRSNSPHPDLPRYSRIRHPGDGSSRPRPRSDRQLVHIGSAALPLPRGKRGRVLPDSGSTLAALKAA